jgi:hypothetical protein
MFKGVLSALIVASMIAPKSIPLSPEKLTAAIGYLKLRIGN